MTPAVLRETSGVTALGIEVSVELGPASDIGREVPVPDGEAQSDHVEDDTSRVVTKIAGIGSMEKTALEPGAREYRFWIDGPLQDHVLLRLQVTTEAVRGEGFLWEQRAPGARTPGKHRGIKHEGIGSRRTHDCLELIEAEGVVVCRFRFRDRPAPDWRMFHRALIDDGLETLTVDSVRTPPEVMILDGVSMTIESQDGAVHRYDHFDNPWAGDGETDVTADRVFRAVMMLFSR